MSKAGSPVKVDSYEDRECVGPCPFEDILLNYVHVYIFKWIYAT